jgi:catechol 2,3-dioxygenase-like lactoylglutathione lyase family enzyme
MFSLAVSDMVKAKDFYADKLGLKFTTDYRQDEVTGGYLLSCEDCPVWGYHSYTPHSKELTRQMLGST